MIIKHGKKTLDIPKVVEVSEIGKIRGLMFRRRENAPALLFNFRKFTKMKIHSFFVFFPFIAFWLDDKDNVVEFRKVDSWEVSISPSVKYKKLLEIPLNNFYSPRIKNLVEQKV
jgi:uncharacterized membrane protein (UPF0127 family)